jgi:superfamily II DNA or RNA helicase
MQLPTGGGKTVIVSQMVSTASKRNHIIWFVVPRNEIMDQTQEHFLKWKINHAVIAANRNESIAYSVHVVSKDTLIRRIKAGKIKKYPSFIIFDEAHVAIDQQAFIISHLPEDTKVLAISATPERTDGRGLSDIYQDIVYGPSIRELVELGYLAQMRYFSPPLEGIESLHRKGTEYDADELEALLKRRAVYGKAIQHYKEIAHERPAIVFCRNIKSAEVTAHKFREAGYNFESIDGRMSKKKRKAILDGVRDGRLHGVTSVDLCIYGLDIPKLEVAIMLRPTISKAVFFQQIGRVLRPAHDKTAIIIDHVSNMAEFGYPLHDQEWNFYGREKRKPKGKSADVLKLCTKCFLYYSGSTCPNCGNENAPRKPGNIMEIDGRLVEIKGPIKLADRDNEERREIQDAINTALKACRTAEQSGEIDPGAVGELLKIAEDIGRSAMWVYWKLSATYTDKDGNVKRRNTVNTPLLHEIKRQKGYANGWAWYKQKEIRERLQRHDSEIEDLRKAAGV